MIVLLIFGSSNIRISVCWITNVGMNEWNEPWTMWNLSIFPNGVYELRILHTTGCCFSVFTHQSRFLALYANFCETFGGRTIENKLCLISSKLYCKYNINWGLITKLWLISTEVQSSIISALLTINKPCKWILVFNLWTIRAMRFRLMS